MIKGGQRSSRLTFSSSSYSSGRRFCRRRRAPPSPNPSSSSSERIFLLPPLEFYVASRPPPRRFRFCLPFLSFFVVFIIFIPRDDRGVVYMRELEKIGGFGGFIATGLRRFEYVRQR